MIENGKHDFERRPVKDAKRRDHLSRITIVLQLFIL